VAYYARPDRHTIEDISFKEDFILCDCDWRGPVAEFQPHRRAAIKEQKAREEQSGSA